MQDYCHTNDGVLSTVDVDRWIEGGEAMRYVLGIDLGTSSVKALLLREDGAVAATATQGYPIATPRSGWAEQDPAAWWRALCDALVVLLTGPQISPETIAA